MKVGVFSDSHDDIPRLRAATGAAVAAGAEVLLHCGDVVAAVTLARLPELPAPLHVIHGNNTGDLYTMAIIASKPSSLVTYHGQDAGIRLGGRRIFMVHYPHYGEAMAKTGDWDLVCCGHDHVADIRRIGNLSGGETVLANPGTVGAIKAPATWILGDLDSMEFEIRDVPLPEKQATGSM